MYTQFIEAAHDDLPTPQLFDVNQETVSAWVEKMKELAARALASGAINDESTQLSQAVDNIIGDTTHTDNIAPFETEGGIGVAIDPLALDLNTTGGTQQNVFVPPTTDTVREVMPLTESAKKRAAKVDEKLISRQTTAQHTLESKNLQPDPKVSGKRRCNVCLKYFDSEYVYMMVRRYHTYATNNSVHLRTTI